MRWAHELAANPPLAVAAAKRTMRFALDSTFEANGHHVMSELVQLMRTAELHRDLGLDERPEDEEFDDNVFRGEMIVGGFRALDRDHPDFAGRVVRNQASPEPLADKLASAIGNGFSKAKDSFDAESSALLQ